MTVSAKKKKAKEQTKGPSSSSSFEVCEAGVRGKCVAAKLFVQTQAPGVDFGPGLLAAFRRNETSGLGPPGWSAKITRVNLASCVRSESHSGDVLESDHRVVGMVVPRKRRGSAPRRCEAGRRIGSTRQSAEAPGRCTGRSCRELGVAAVNPAAARSTVAAPESPAPNCRDSPKSQRRHPASQLCAPPPRTLKSGSVLKVQQKERSW